tara:strand:- start:312 stop:536 length:225 start_codon:yes stop_codon:yes gene_type:complete
MSTQEYHIVIKKEEYENLQNKIKILESKIIKIETSIYNFENKKNILQLTFFHIKDYMENLMLYIMEFIIDVPPD